jgi:hypothetical protein
VRSSMNGRMSWETWTLSAVVVAGLIGLLAALNTHADRSADVEFDEINDSPIGI